MALFIQSNVLCCCILVILLSFSLSLIAEVLVVTKAKNLPITLSKNQVRNIFLGRVTSLPDGGSMTPVDQPESSPLRNEFYLKVVNMSASQAKELWAILHFAGGGVPPREGTDSLDVIRILNSTHGAIGYIDRDSLDSSLNVIYVAP